ncbi:hypothetical protein FBU30_005556 [Linnemannia zychae]|nr:hypothetical protein FBU30_005556 [Linnemannia zychae]
MVTTRSRGNKKAAGLDTAPEATTAATANTPPTSAMEATSSPLKRKSGATPTDVSPITKIAKTDLDPELDMNTEPPMPPVPSSTPIATTTPNQQEHHHPQPQQQQNQKRLSASAQVSQPSLDNTLATAASTAATAANGASEPSTRSPPPPPAPTPVTVPSSNSNEVPPVPVVTAPLEPSPEVEASLEAIKEPLPDSAPLPELTTVLTESAADHQQIIPPAPTAPALSTIAAPAPVSVITETAPATGLGVPPPAPILAATEDPTIHGNASVNKINHSSNSMIPPADLTPMPAAASLPVDLQGNKVHTNNISDEVKDKTAPVISNDIKTVEVGDSAPAVPINAPGGVEQKTESHSDAQTTPAPVKPL